MTSIFFMWVYEPAQLLQNPTLVGGNLHVYWFVLIDRLHIIGAIVTHCVGVYPLMLFPKILF